MQLRKCIYIHMYICIHVYVYIYHTHTHEELPSAAGVLRLRRRAAGESRGASSLAAQERETIHQPEESCEVAALTWMLGF